MESTLDDQVSLLTALSDPTRLRLLALLSEHELPVVELTQITELGQSKVSSHLSRLKEQALIVDRREGTSTHYRLNAHGLSDTARQLWSTLRAAHDDSVLRRDKARALKVIAARDKTTWPERMAGELERHYSPGRTWDALTRALSCLIRAGSVLDVGAGDGTVAELLAARSARYVCLDVSPRLAAAAHARLSRIDAVTVACADMHALPFADASFDHVLLLNTLSFAGRPARALDEATRVLRPEGQLLIVTVAKHGHMDVAAQYGHVQPGFAPAWLKRRLGSCSMRVETCEITSRERARPHFEIVTCLAEKKVKP